MTRSKRTRNDGATAVHEGPNPQSHTDKATTLTEHALLTTAEAAVLTTYTPHGLENLRSAGRGPAFIKIRGGAVAYRLQDLLAWQESHRISTLDQR